jgi:CheY-like chemotaxis protein
MVPTSRKRILLVEDDLPKRNQILDILAIEKCAVNVATSINSAIAFIDGDQYDGVLLDMSLPTFNEGPTFGSGGRQQDFGGRQILTYMWELEMQTSVLLVTQLPGFKDETGKEIGLSELDATLRRDFEGLYVGYTSFQHSTDSWVEELRKFVRAL